MTVVRSQLLRKRPREDRREGRAEEYDDDDYEDESESDGEDDDVDGLRLPNGFIILNDDESDDDESDYYPRGDYGNDDGDDREEESMGEEIECYFAGKNEYDCHKQGSKARVTKKVPENPNVPNDAKGKPCCGTCYDYWRSENLECYFAGKNEYDCHKQGFKSSVIHIVPKNANVPNDAKGQRCCVACYNYWRRKAPA